MRIDNTGFGNIKVIQTEGMGYGVDSVLLAAFAAGETGARGVRKAARIADLGSGSGVVGFIMCHKADAEVVGYEKRESAVDRASRAAEMNEMTDRISFVQKDVVDIPVYGQTPEHFDAVVSNPPYFRKSSAIPCMIDDKFVARHETTADIGDFGRAAAYLLDKGGDFYLVHRPDRLVDIFEAMRLAGVEPKEIQFVLPKPGEAANIVLIHGVKGAGRELKLLPDITVHNEDGSYTDVIEKLYERK